MSIEFYIRVGDSFFLRSLEFFQYPGGEWDLKCSDNTLVGDEYAYVRGTDPVDFVKLGLWQNACKEYPTIVMPYLPAARADKGLTMGANVYANLIPEFKRLVVLDAHSDYMVDYLRDLRGGEVINEPAKFILPTNPNEYTGIIAPDEGAVRRASEVAAQWGLPVYLAKKTRDFKTGNLTGFAPPENLPPKSDLLVVDDICDGGGTFVGLAKSIYELPDINTNLSLYVSHGIFSKGLASLFDYYDRIITTDSFTNEDYGLSIRPIKMHLLRRASQ